MASFRQSLLLRQRSSSGVSSIASLLEQEQPPVLSSDSHSKGFFCCAEQPPFLSCASSFFLLFPSCWSCSSLRTGRKGARRRSSQQEGNSKGVAPSSCFFLAGKAHSKTQQGRKARGSFGQQKNPARVLLLRKEPSTSLTEPSARRREATLTM